MSLNKKILSVAANESRGLSMDAVSAANSGHLGLPLGAAEIGAVLFGNALKYLPSDPDWINRDRFILSAGHGSMFLYSWLYLSGYNLPIEEIKNFRQLHRITPGHPEYGETDGVEATTGPLGQGVGNAVGIALACKKATQEFNTNSHKILDNHVICLAGDGCLQEGVAAEASSFATHAQLDNLIIIYDSNDVTLDAMADQSQSEDVGGRYQALGFDVLTIDGHNMDSINQAISISKEKDNGKPKFIVAKTEIGRGIPEVSGTNKGHGEAGVKFVAAARKGLGLPDEKFFVSDETRTYFEGHQLVLAENYKAWKNLFEEWSKQNPDLSEKLDAYLADDLPDNLITKIPEFPPEDKLATRKAGGIVLQSIADAVPQLVSGSADLYGSTLNYIKSSIDFTGDTPLGRNIRFGIREHAMGAIMNGIAYHGFYKASGATFLAFSDYMRGAIRLAALAKLPLFYIFTHDSVGVGEDGPTHQPVEMTSGLRTVPNLDVIRPGDPEETAAAFTAAVLRKDGPTALVLTRQALPNLSEIPVKTRREGTLKGGYIAIRESGTLDSILIATGSELSIAVEAAKQLGSGTRVVSLPSFEIFEKQNEEYRNSVLPKYISKRISIEAGVTGLWGKYIGFDGKSIGIDRFGLSAPGNTVMKELGISVEHVVATAKSL